MATLRRYTPLLLLVFFCAHSNAAELVRLTPDNYDEFVPAGKEVDAIYGDWLVRNSNIVAVIADALPTRKANMTTGGVAGCVIDLTLRNQPNDLLGAYYPVQGRELQLIEIRTEDRLCFSSIDKEFEAPDTSVPQLAKQFTFVYKTKPQPNKPHIQLTYQIADGDQSVLIETTYINTHDQPIEIALKEKIRADVGFEFDYDQSKNLISAHDSWWQQAYGIYPGGTQPEIDLEKLKKQPPQVWHGVALAIAESGGIKTQTW